MSGWIAGKIKINCSLEILQKVLIGVMPKWESRIIVDPLGQIVVGEKEAPCQLVVTPKQRGSEYETGDNRSQIGFQRNKDGTWTIHSMDYSNRDLKDRIAVQFGVMKAKSQASDRGAHLVENTETDKGQEMVFHVPVGPKYKLLA